MICFKGFNSELEATCGNGRMKFEQYKTYIEEKSKTVRSGFHCAEYPMHCLVFYPLGNNNRYFRVEAAGDIDDDNTMVACTQLTIKNELTVKEMVQYSLLYIMRHRNRDLKHSSRNCIVCDEAAVLTVPGEGVCIAYGSDPRVKAMNGNYIGIVKYLESGEIVGGLWEVGKLKPEKPEETVQEDKWYTVDDIGNLIDWSKS